MINKEYALVTNVQDLIKAAFHVKKKIEYSNISTPRFTFTVTPPKYAEEYEGSYNEKDGVAAFVYDGVFYMIPFTSDVKKVLKDNFKMNKQLFVMFTHDSLPRKQDIRKKWLDVVYISEWKKANY